MLKRHGVANTLRPIAHAQTPGEGACPLPYKILDPPLPVCFSVPVFHRLQRRLVFAKMDRPISDESNLLLELHPVRAKWRDLGIALKMKQTDLDAIEKDTTGAVDRALQNMLTQWLKSDEDCTWSQIAEALDSSVVSEKKMAKSLRTKYCADYVLESERTTNNGGEGSGQV